MSEERGLEVLKYAMLLLLAVGIIHALYVLGAGVYEFDEYGVRGALRGWHARGAALLELALLALIAVQVWRSKWLS